MAQPHAATSFRAPNTSYSFRKPSDYRPDNMSDVAYRRSHSDLSNSYALQPYTGSGFQDSRETSSSSWTMSVDPEVKRKRRLVEYKVYGLEGKVKSSLRKSFRWLKDKYFDMRYGWD